jgi:hypothetical protein
MHQPELLQPKHLPTKNRWSSLFAALPVWPQPPRSRGRKPVDRNALLRTLIYQRLSRVRFLQQVCNQLADNPPLLAEMGFDPYSSWPTLERLSSFLSDPEHHRCLVAIRVELILQLIAERVISPAHIGLDSCPVASWVKENNLKTALRRWRYDKNTPPKADPDARLGVSIHFPHEKGSSLHYFWGYRNHVLADLESELPLWEITEPNSIGEPTVAHALLEAASILPVRVRSVSADAEYDSDAILNTIHHDLQAEAFVAVNPSHLAKTKGFRRDGNNVFCPAGLPMYRSGKMNQKERVYIQYRCPFYRGPKPDLLMCPIDHPKFSTQKGCNYLWRITPNPRDQIPYGTDYFKQHYARRTAIERGFSRLLSLTIQEPTVRGLVSIRNHCTITHIAVLLVALTAHRHGLHDKIRFCRSLVPNFLS